MILRRLITLKASVSKKFPFKIPKLNFLLQGRKETTYFYKKKNKKTLETPKECYLKYSTQFIIHSID